MGFCSLVLVIGCASMWAFCAVLTSLPGLCLVVCFVVGMASCCVLGRLGMAVGGFWFVCPVPGLWAYGLFCF